VTATFQERFKRIAALPDANSLLQLLSFLDSESIQLDMISRACKDLIATTDLQNTTTANYVGARKTNFVQKIFRPVPSPNNPERHVQKRDKLESSKNSGSLHIPGELLGVILSPAQLQGALHQLQDLSLVTLLDDVSPLELRMHNLTKFMVQELTMNSGRQVALFEAAAAIICHAFGMVEDRMSPRWWLACESIVPHIEALTTWMISRKKANRRIASTNVEVAGYFRSRGRYKDAERLYRQALGSPEEERNFTLNSTELIHVLCGLAGVLVKQGQYDEAEKLYQRALADKKRLSRDSDMESLLTAQGLIEVYDKQGRYRDAVDLGEIILEGIRAKASKRIPDLLQTMHNLGLAYGHQAQFDKAEEMFQYVMNESGKIFGSDHPDTLRTINAFANLYDRQNRYEEAAVLYMQAMDGREKQFGPAHPQTLRSVCGLANLYLRTGLLEEAKVLYTRALRGSEIYFAVDNPDVLRAVHGIASALACQDDLLEAERQFKRAIVGRTALLGKDHADTLRSIEGLATVFDLSNQYDKAVELYHKVHVARTRLLGAEHPESLKVAQALAILEDQRRKGNNGKITII
jgi:tetratricopeptide (TPR) repeat protein